jgi:4-amino-4-deoxy-L-arabinose transferase-like glycosyltransferase
MRPTRDTRCRRHGSAPPAPPLRQTSPRTAAGILVCFAAVFITLEINSYTRRSAAWDEPMHITSGYAALAHQEYRLDPSHPPFARLWASLPLLVAEPHDLDVRAIDRGATLNSWLADAYQFAHEFLYLHNDADRLLYPSRFMVVLLGVLLGVLVFMWTYEWLGLAPAATALVLYTVEPNLSAHATLVTTDLPFACFMFGSVYFLWRTCRDQTTGNVLGVSTCVALATTTKFSAVLLIPIVAILILLAVARRAMTLRFALVVVTAIVVSTLAAIWAVYGFHYEPSRAGAWVFQIHDPRTSTFSGVASVAAWIDAHHLLPNAFTQGFVYSVSSAQHLGTYLAGEYSDDGWWYYFPVAFALKTPLALMALSAVGIITWARRRQLGHGVGAFVLVSVTVYLGAAMASGINVGVRHILPLYPFVLLLGVFGLHQLMARGRTASVVAAGLCLACAVEFAVAYPYTSTFFNQLAGGPENGFRYLADSNVGWGQGLKGLKRWMDRTGVSHVNLAYFGQADPAYYGIDCTYLPGSPMFAVSSIARPRLPGYVAISSTVLTGVYLQPAWRLFYRPFRDLEPDAVIGNSIRVYWVNQWPDTTARAAEDGDVDAHRFLGDALLFGQRWPTRALRHYRVYLNEHPEEPRTLVNAAIALASTGDIDGASGMLRRAVALDPDNGEARLTLAKILFGRRDLDGARRHAERAVVLLPSRPDAYELLGSVRAVEGRIDEAARYFQHALKLDPDFTLARDDLDRLNRSRRR